MKLLLKLTLAIFAIFSFEFVVASELGACEKIFSISASALSNKAKGMSKEKLSGALPPFEAAQNSEPLRSMHEIVEEIFNFEIKDQFVYSVYRTELCMRRASGKQVPDDFAKVYPVLESCSKEKEEEKVGCAMKAAGSSPDENT